MKYICALILGILFSSCTPFYNNKLNYNSPKMDLNSAWIDTSKYNRIPDKDQFTDIKSPIQFEKDGGGDCEDFSGHLIYELGEGSIIWVYIKSKNANHCIVKYRDSYIEPQIYGEYINLDSFGYIFVMEISYDVAMAYMTNGGSKVIP